MLNLPLKLIYIGLSDILFFMTYLE